MARSDLIKPEIRSIAPYVPGKSIEEIAKKYCLSADKIIKLGSNENVLGPSPKALEAMVGHAQDINIYPSADAGELVSAISKYVGMPEDMIVGSGPGMDGLLDGLMRLLISPGSEVVISTPTFSYYELSARANGGTPVFVRRNDDFSIDVDSLKDAVTDATKMMFICSPNNPSGNSMSETELRSLVENVSCLVFVDEAYVEFADRTFVSLVNEYDNLIIGRTLSKAFGLAGLRIGYGIMPAWLKVEYMKAGTPFNVSSVALVAGSAALSDEEHLKRSQEMVREGRKYLMDYIPFTVYDSQANFVLVDVSPVKAKDVCEHLLRQGIIVRDCTSFRDAGESLIRVTIGTAEQNKKVVNGFSSF
ncbi:histidinol-phosphate aminotransferase [Methanohalophilus levihalophilus]|uniref:histidinol-phosphate transaminase n=1 Tax=Methanohalophilus levihalophilus TaxID=1431282 RepID=UPI001AEB67C9|nr:histidinol-phosphate transaminase [Methanohalophilus levihalophilus]MBP2030388.1 histidinol-phosphate aminotransferase [Methanohalophilus levihalophilus]